MTTEQSFHIEQQAKLARLHRIAAEQAKRDQDKHKKQHHERSARGFEKHIRDYADFIEYA